MTTASPPTVLTIRLFARYAELLGTDELEVPAEGIQCVGDLLDRIRQLPGGVGIARSALVAVNLRQARPDARVQPGDEIALLPPLAGG